MCHSSVKKKKKAKKGFSLKSNIYFGFHLATHPAFLAEGVRGRTHSSIHGSWVRKQRSMGITASKALLTMTVRSPGWCKNSGEPALASLPIEL